MEGQTITISMEKYEKLIETKASIRALEHFVNSEKYPSRKVMCDIVGIEYKGEE